MFDNGADRSAMISTNDFVHRCAFVFVLLGAMLAGGCGSGGSADNVGSSQPASIPVPERVQAKINSDASNVEAKITIDGGAEQAMTISGGSATFAANGLTPGAHTVVITFYQTAGSERIVLAQNTSQVSIVAGQTASLGEGGLTYETASFDADGDQVPNVEDSDNDNDGILDDDEAAYGMSPFDADSDDDNISDANEVALVMVATAIPAAVQARVDTLAVPIKATIKVDAGPERDMTIANSNANFSIPGLLPGSHTIVITFYQTATGGQMELVRHSGAVSVVAGLASEFGAGALDYDPVFDRDGDQVNNIDDPDNDNDGIADADEARYEKNPFSADTDNDTVADADEVAVQVSGRGDHTCIVLFSGKVRCWGANDAGQLGDGGAQNSSTSVLVNGVTNATTIRTSETHSCAQLQGGGVQCWGSNASQEIDVATLAGASDVQIAFFISCGIRSNGQPLCVGDQTNPMMQYQNSVVVAIGPGAYHSCVVVSGGEVSCYSNPLDLNSNLYGQLGNNSVAPPLLGPVSVVNINPPTTVAVAVAVGTSHSCALLQDKTVKCWGKNDLSQLGNSGAGATSLVAIDVGTIVDAAAIAVGAFHNCALQESGGVLCWGSNTSGQLGNGGNSDPRNDPVQVSGITNAISISGGESHSCAVLANGRVKCWGRNSSGQLGNSDVPTTGTENLSRVPVYVSGF
jgi:alpha-tubulin suppressor-like RCC1 family protein